MKDVWGNDLKIGDQVCVVKRSGRYIDNLFGEVIGFTPAGHLVRIRENKTGDEFKAGERIFRKPS